MNNDENILKSGKETNQSNAGKEESYEEFIQSQQEIRTRYEELNSLLKSALDELNYKHYRKI